ncbi:MAG: hypothetical protein AAFY41_07445 [Bacteroidota bacterium]
MVNVPRDVGQDWEKLTSELRSRVITKISDQLNVDLAKHIETERIVDPVKIATDTMSHQGSLYGTSSNNKYAAFLRHPNFSKQIDNLYFCGGSAHPGGGIPLCLLSARIVSNLIADAA